MCHLITVAVEPSQVDAVEIFRAIGLTARPAANPSVSRCFSGAEVVLDVTDGRCSCAIAVGIVGSPPLDERAETARYLRKGWSRQKAERAVAAKRKAHANGSVNAYCENFLTALARLQASGAKVETVSHDYSGEFRTEPVSVVAREQLTLIGLRERGGVLPEDTLLTIVG